MLTSRAISWTLDDVGGNSVSGSVSIRLSVPELVDTVDSVVYVQKTLTYPLAAGQSDAVITTDNTGTNPAAGSWGYDITVELAPGIPTINVQAAIVPAGSGPYPLASILAAAGL